MKIDKQENEVKIIQYTKPNGKARTVYAPVGAKYARMAENMIISAETISNNRVAIYVCNKNEPQEDEMLEIAINGPGKHSPTEVLKRMIATKTQMDEERDRDEDK